MWPTEGDWQGDTDARLSRDHFARRHARLSHPACPICQRLKSWCLRNSLRSLSEVK